MAEGSLSAEQQTSLAGRIRAGNPAAEEEFARLFRARLAAMMTVRTRDPQVAADLAQDALMAALRSLRDGQIRDAGRLAAFVYGTARNVLGSYLRTRALHPHEERLERAPDLANPVEHFETLERADLVRSVLQGLEPTDRGILLLVFVDGMKLAEIAARVGMSPEAVRQRKSRALRKVSERAREASRTPGRQPPPEEGHAWTVRK